MRQRKQLLVAVMIALLAPFPFASTYHPMLAIPWGMLTEPTAEVSKIYALVAFLLWTVVYTVVALYALKVTARMRARRR